jgi:hypothetical protein
VNQPRTIEINQKEGEPLVFHFQSRLENKPAQQKFYGFVVMLLYRLLECFLFVGVPYCLYAAWRDQNIFWITIAIAGFALLFGGSITIAQYYLREEKLILTQTHLHYQQYVSVSALPKWLRKPRDEVIPIVQINNVELTNCIEYDGGSVTDRKYSISIDYENEKEEQKSLDHVFTLGGSKNDKIILLNIILLIYEHITPIVPQDSEDDKMVSIQPPENRAFSPFSMK